MYFICALHWIKTCYRFVKRCFFILRQEFKTAFFTQIRLSWKYKGYFYDFFCAAALFIMNNTNYTEFFLIYFLCDTAIHFFPQLWSYTVPLVQKSILILCCMWMFLTCGLGSQM